MSEYKHRVNDTTNFLFRWQNRNGAAFGAAKRLLHRIYWLYERHPYWLQVTPSVGEQKWTEHQCNQILWAILATRAGFFFAFRYLNNRRTYIYSWKVSYWCMERIWQIQMYSTILVLITAYDADFSNNFFQEMFYSICRVQFC